MRQGGDDLRRKRKNKVCSKDTQITGLAGVTGDNNFMTSGWKGVCENPTAEEDQVALLTQPCDGVHEPES